MRITVNKTSGVYNVGQTVGDINVVRGDNAQYYEYADGRKVVTSRLLDLKEFAGPKSEYTQNFMGTFHMNWANYRELHKEAYADYNTKIVAYDKKQKGLTQKTIDKSRCVSLQMSTTGCRESKNSILENHSGYVCIDLDHFKDKSEFYKVFFTLNTFKNELTHYIYSWDVSFSGDGFHLIMYIGKDVANDVNDYRLYKSRFEWVYYKIRSAFDVDFDSLVDLHFYNEPEQQVKLGCNLMHFNPKFSERNCDNIFEAYADEINDFTYKLFDADRDKNRFTTAKYACNQSCEYLNTKVELMENTNKKMIWNYNNRAGLRSALYLLNVPNMVETYVAICSQNPNLQGNETVESKASEWAAEMTNYKPTGNEYISASMKMELKNYGIYWSEKIEDTIVNELQAKYKIVLDDNEYVGQHTQEILNICASNGIYQMISPTGSGKNKWIEDLLQDMLCHKRILISEPYTSIIDGKYCNEWVDKLIRQSHYNETHGINNIVTNYMHLLEIPVEDIVKNYDLLIIDESHLLCSEIFRAEQLIKVVNVIKNVSKRIPVILQTATPYIEHSLFDIKSTICFVKKLQKHIKYDIILNDANNKMFELYDRIKEDIANGKKVYIYKSTMSEKEAVKFKQNIGNDFDIAIYHKGRTGSEDMDYINTNHCLGDKYNVLLSSVYFSVGNDINDECEWSVYILGWYTAQEDNQVVGRLRKANEISVHCVLSSNMVDNLIYESINYDKLKQHRLNQFHNMYNDMQHRNKSVSIGNATMSLQNIHALDLETLAQMSCVDDIYSVYNYKMKYLKVLGYDIDDTQIVNGERLTFEDDCVVKLCDESSKYINSLLTGFKTMNNRDKANVIDMAIKNGWENLEYVKNEDCETDYSRDINDLIRNIKWIGNNMGTDTVNKILADTDRLRIIANVDVVKNILHAYKDGCDVSEIKSLMLWRTRANEYEKEGKIDEFFAQCYAYFIKMINNDANANKTDWQLYVKSYKNIAEHFAKLHPLMYDYVLVQLSKLNSWEEGITDLFEWLANENANELYVPDENDMKMNTDIVENIDDVVYKYVLKYMQGKIRPNKKHKERKKPNVTYDGVVYENIDKAAELLGKSIAWCRKHCKTVK